METNKVICDTNIISEYLRGNEDIARKINEIGFDNILITPVVYIELIRWLSVFKGLTTKQRKDYKTAFDSLKILHLNKEISIKAMEISNSDNTLDAPDILIGTTAVYHKTPIFTLNKKHFKRIKNIKIYN